MADERQARETAETAGTAETPDPSGAAGLPDPSGTAEPAGPSGAVPAILEQTLKDAGLSWESPEPGAYVVQLPGTRKLSTTLSLRLGRHALSLNAFVIRHPDENAPGVHRWLLERNLRLYGVSYAIDKLGDVYLAGKLSLDAVTPAEVDRLLGVVLEEADGSFNTLLELGFASAIRREYEWRVSRGESTRNLDAFTHLTNPR